MCICFDVGSEDDPESKNINYIINKLNDSDVDEPIADNWADDKSTTEDPYNVPTDDEDNKMDDGQ